MVDRTIAFNPKAAAIALVLSKLRRDFERDPNLRAEFYVKAKQDFERAFLLELEGVGKVVFQYDGFGLTWNRVESSTSLTLEGAELVRCDFLSPGSGILRMQYAFANDTRSIDLQLLRTGISEYGWFYEGEVLNGSMAAEFCATKLLELGNYIVGGEVLLNPQPSGGTVNPISYHQPANPGDAADT